MYAFGRAQMPRAICGKTGGGKIQPGASGVHHEASSQRALLAGEAILHPDASEAVRNVDRGRDLGVIDGDGAVRHRIDDVFEGEPLG